jgi:hypothetical protein
MQKRPWSAAPRGSAARRRRLTPTETYSLNAAAEFFQHFGPKRVPELDAAQKTPAVARWRRWRVHRRKGVRLSRHRSGVQAEEGLNLATRAAAGSLTADGRPAAARSQRRPWTRSFSGDNLTGGCGDNARAGRDRTRCRELVDALFDWPDADLHTRRRIVRRDPNHHGGCGTSLRERAITGRGEQVSAHDRTGRGLRERLHAAGVNGGVVGHDSALPRVGVEPEQDPILLVGQPLLRGLRLDAG